MANTSLFPLPLSPIEICWLLEDCPSHPMQFFLRLQIDGHLEHSAFEAAVEKTIERHPLFTAIVEQTGTASWQWVAGPTDPLKVNWLKGDKNNLPKSEPLDIYSERGLRVIVIEDETDSAVTLQFQHTVCDGLSASEFAGDLLTAYAEQLDPDQTYKYKRLKQKDLTNRGNSGLSNKEMWRWRLRSLAGLARFRKFYKKKPVFLLSRNRPSEDEPIETPASALYKRFDRQQAVEINKRARDTGANLNSKLLAAMFTGFVSWRKTVEPNHNSDDLFRVTIPMSMRNRCHRATSAANIVSLVCFDRAFEECGDISTIQKSIDKELQIIQQEHRGLVLLSALKLMRRWPGQLAAGIRRKRFSGSTLLSNVGPILTNCLLPKEQGKIKIGDSTVTQAEFLAVLRPGHCATVAASSYAGQLTLAFHYDPRMISDREAGELFERYIGCL